MEMVAPLDRRAVRLQDLLVRVDERGEVRTSDFLLALDDELQVDRRSAFDRAPGLRREELHDQVPLRVPTTASPELAVLNRRVEWVALPFVQRVDRLDVVVLVHHEGGLPLVDDHLSEDDVGTPFRRIFAGLETVFPEPWQRPP